MKTLFLSIFFLAGTGYGLQVFNKGNGTEPKNLDPHTESGVPEHHVISGIFEGLVDVDPKTAEPIAGVAEKLPPTLSKDKKVYTFQLRKNAKWSNGEALTASDFVYAFRRLVDPKTASPYAYHGYYLKNGEKINKGELKDLTQLGVKAVDNHTLEITLERPTSFFVPLLYHFSFFPVHQKTVEKYGMKWTRPENIVSNGVFKLKSWEVNKVITAVKNEHYWDKDSVKLDQINFYPVENTSTEEKMFRAKELHITETIPIEKIPFWKKDKSGVYKENPYMGTYFYMINTTKKGLDDKRVRKALAMTIDRKEIVEKVSRGGQLPALAFTPPGAGGFFPKKYLPETVTEKVKADAKKLLADAGYPGGKNLPTVEVLYNTNDGHKKIAEAIQQMWKNNLGINVTLVNQEWKVYLNSRKTLSYHVARAGWVADFNDPHNFVECYISNGGNNQTGWSSPKYDELLDRALAYTSDQSNQRKSVYDQLEDILMDDMPVIPIYTYTRNWLQDPKVKGWYPNIMDFHPYKFVSLE